MFTITQKPLPRSALCINQPENNIVLNSGNVEMLKIGPDGFWVRGIKLKQDDKEVEQVYNCFKEWLTWSTLNRT
jgi:hypothetical protein